MDDKSKMIETRLREGIDILRSLKRNNCSFTFYTYFEIINEFTLAARSDKRPNIYIGDIYMFLYLNRRRRQFDIKNVPKNKFREKSDIIQESINYYIYFSL